MSKYSRELKRTIAKEYLVNGLSSHQLAARYSIESRQIRYWGQVYVIHGSHSFEPAWENILIEKEGHSRGYRRLSLSEVMTMTILLHQRHYRDFKHFYCDYLLRYQRQDFPNLVIYTRFVEIMTELLIPFTVFVKCCCPERCDGLSFRITIAFIATEFLSDERLEERRQQDSFMVSNCLSL